MEKLCYCGVGGIKINLQNFAGLDEIITAHADKFEGSNIQEQFGEINAKLNELGYDILINHREKAEFVPSTRLSEVVAQRDGFKQKVEELNRQLGELQNVAGNSAELNAKIQSLMDDNKKLLEDLESAKIDMQIMVAAKDAHDPKAILPFIKKENIKVTTTGILGIEEEIARIKSEMPFMFKDGESPSKKKGGVDMGDDKGGQGGIKDMNAMIRRMAGKTF